MASRDESTRNRETDLKSLVSRALARDAGAWSELVLQFNPLVYGTALRTGISRDDAADVCQAVWIAFLERGHAIRDPQALPRWLAVTARRTALRGLDRSNPSTIPLDETLEADTPEADLLLEQEERSARLRLAVSQLPERCRTLLGALFGEEAADYREVSRRLELPVGSIGPTRARCLARLYEILRRRGFEF